MSSNMDEDIATLACSVELYTVSYYPGNTLRLFQSLRDGDSSSIL